MTFNASFTTRYFFKKNGLDYEDSAFENIQNGSSTIGSLISLIGSDLTFLYYLHKFFAYSRLFPIAYDVFDSHTPSMDYSFSVLFLVINLMVFVYPFVKLVVSLLDLGSTNQLNTLELRKKPTDDSSSSPAEVTVIFNLLDPCISFLYAIYRYILAIPIFVH